MASQPTGKEIQKQDPLALRIPPGHLDVHFIDVILARQRFAISLGNLASLSPSQDLGALLSDFPPSLLQPLLCLRLHYTRFY